MATRTLSYYLAQDVDEEVVEMEEDVVKEEEADRIWQECGANVIDMDDLHSGDKGDDDQPPQTRKRILREKRGG
ncbi:hypothetical protein Tco_1229433 [Tanacetum coccineum]